MTGDAHRQYTGLYKGVTNLRGVIVLRVRSAREILQRRRWYPA